MLDSFRNVVGVIANCDEILDAEALKAAHFVDMCGRRRVPLLFLQNSSLPDITGSRDVEVLKARSSMAGSIATAPVPKLSVTLTGCYQDDYLLMVSTSSA